MKKYLMKLDYIGLEPKLKYNGQNRYKTTIGGILSLIIFILMFAGFIHYGNELFERSKPIIISGAVYNPNPSRMSLKPTNFPFSFAVQDPTNFFKDQTIFNVKGFLYTQNRTVDENGKTKIIPKRREVKLVDCDLETHFIGSEKDFSTTDYKNAYCIDPEEEISLKGDFIAPEWSMFQYYVYECRNSTSGNSCKTREEIDKKLKSTFVNVDYGYYFSTPKDYTNPMTKSKTNYFTSSSNYAQKQVTFYLKKVNYTTDKGFLIPDNIDNTYYQVDYIRELQNNIVPGEKDYFLSVTFRLSFTEEVHERSYLKLQVLLAYLGGLYNLFTTVAMLIPNFLLKDYYYIDLLNENFIIPQEQPDKSLPHEEKDKRKQFSMNSPGSFSSQVRLKMNNFTGVIQEASRLPESLDTIKSKFDQIKNGNKMKISNCEYFKMLVCFCVYKKRFKYEKFLYKGKERIKESLNINSYLRNGFRIEKLIHAVLNKDQRILFKEIDYMKSNMLDKNIEFDNIIGAYRNLTSENFTNKEVNDRILELLNEEMIKLMEQFKLLSTGIRK